jgi:hypothetical protein
MLRKMEVALCPSSDASSGFIASPYPCYSVGVIACDSVQLTARPSFGTYKFQIIFRYECFRIRFKQVGMRLSEMFYSVFALEERKKAFPC